MAKKTKKMKTKEDTSGLFIPGGLLMGIGIGLYYGRPDVGALVGLGGGFILMAFMKVFK